MPPKADGVGATTFRERSSKVATQTPDSITRVPAAPIEKQVFDAIQSVIASKRSNEGFGALSLLGLSGWTISSIRPECVE